MSKIVSENSKSKQETMEDSDLFDEGKLDFGSLLGLGYTNGAMSALNDSGLSDAASVAQALSAGVDPIRKQGEVIAEAARLAVSSQAQIDPIKVAGIYADIDGLSPASAERSHLADAILGIKKQQHILDAMADHETIMPRFDHLNIENPTVETNRKLDRIEKQFSQISKIAHDSAQVATDLQAYAAEFLQKFEKAAEDTNQAGSKAIKVGWLALAIAVFIGAGQIFAPSLLEDQESEALRQTVVDLKSEMATLRGEQSAASDRLIEVLQNLDQAIASALRESLADSDQATDSVLRDVLQSRQETLPESE